MSTIRSVLGAWPPRRRVAVALLLPVLTAGFVLVGRASAPASFGWYALTALAAALGSAVLASYLPTAGRGLDLGCTPCAAIAALTVVGATVALRNYGAEVEGPLVAVALLLFGLAQRLSRPVTCATSPR